MSIADKLLQIAENVPKVYDAGRQSIINGKNTIKETITAVGETYIDVPDISEIPFPIKITISDPNVSDLTQITVTKYENLIPFPYGACGGGGRIWEIASSNTTYTIDHSGEITITGTPTASTTCALDRTMVFEEGASYYGTARIGYYNDAGTKTYKNLSWTSALVWGTGYTVAEVCVNNGTLNSEINKRIMPIITTIKTPEVITINADGVGECTSPETPNHRLTLMINNGTPTTQIIIEYNKSYAIDYEQKRRMNSGLDTKDYIGAYAGATWNNNNFIPTENIIPTNAPYMFYNSGITDLPWVLAKHNVTLDFSTATSLAYAFSYTISSRLPKIDLTKCPSFSQLFSNSEVQYIEELCFPTVNVTSSSNIFSSCKSLREIPVISGTITFGINLQHSTLLTKNTIINFFNALSDTKTGLTITFSKTAVNNAFGIDVDDETTYPEGSEYYTLRHSKDNWTVAYI